ncbi:MAG: Rieske 2Fe-2S domain-containing protein [Desulfurococcales archaeon]|nr:Rieske 2Fe-2S domain-containing protein [Desulfurococcales archaeon]
MGIKRRDFLRILGAAGAVGALGAFIPPGLRYISPEIPPQQPYPRSLLVWEDGSPVKASELEVNKPYLFHYPLKTTPAFLFNLGDADGNPVEVPPMELPYSMDPLEEEPYVFRIRGNRVEVVDIRGRGGVYQFPGGVGPNKSIIALSGRCQHFACDAPAAVKYYPPGKPVPLARSPILEKGGVIYCICHGSAYDPYRGGIVLLAPAPRPLPPIILEWDQANDTLYAVGMPEGSPTILKLFCNTCAEEEELAESEVIVTPIEV